jgi:hypothetical protein
MKTRRGQGVRSVPAGTTQAPCADRLRNHGAAGAVDADLNRGLSIGNPIAHGRPRPHGASMIERAYPGVYLATLENEARPIDGVPTAQPGSDAPGWTSFGGHDPGITLVELIGFLSEPLLHRAELMPHGTVQGLAPTQTPSEQSPLHLSPGLAIDPAGHSIVSELPAVASKYIGETEKHIEALLPDAVPGGTLRHYDDTRALFGKDD